MRSGPCLDSRYTELRAWACLWILRTEYEEEKPMGGGEEGALAWTSVISWGPGAAWPGLAAGSLHGPSLVQLKMPSVRVTELGLRTKTKSLSDYLVRRVISEHFRKARKNLGIKLMNYYKTFFQGTQKYKFGLPFQCQAVTEKLWWSRGPLCVMFDIRYNEISLMTVNSNC